MSQWCNIQLSQMRANLFLFIYIFLSFNWYVNVIQDNFLENIKNDCGLVLNELIKNKFSQIVNK